MSEVEEQALEGSFDDADVDSELNSGASTPPAGLERLRELLLEAELLRLDAVEEKVERPIQAEDLADILPQAVAGGDEEMLSVVLTPTVERSLEESVQRNPKVLADAIFPIIGPAIRRSIAQMTADMVESINRTVEHSFTLKGLKWRLEAKRARRPFAEIVLSKSFRYRVEQVFLVHAETGLLLEHVIAPGAPRWDADLVSSMLGAIQDFMSDSFAGGADEAQLEQIEIASGFLIVAPGPHATVAAWVRGTPPAGVRDELYAAAESVQQRLGPELQDFDGDTAPFVVARPLLEACISQQASEASTKKGGGWVLWAIAGVLLVAVVSLLARRHNQIRADELLRSDLRAAFEAAPGIVVRSIGPGEPIPVELLVDPRAPSIDSVIADARLEKVELDLRMQPFLSADPEIVLARFAARFTLPPTARWRLSDGVLSLSGRASAAWLAEVEGAVRWAEGIDSLNTDEFEATGSRSDER